MNTKDFIKALRAVIREEVRSADRQEIGAILTESRSHNQRLAQPKPVQKTRQASKIITGNPILDQVLSETKLTPEFRQSPDIGYDELSYTTKSIPATQPSLMNMDAAEEYYDELPATDPTMPFMKDYSQLLKKADQIASQKQF